MRLETIRIAQNLQKRGLKSRQVIGFMAGINGDLASTLLASFCLACPIAPLHPMLTTHEIVRNLKKSKPAIIFCDSNVYNQLKNALNELEFDVKVFTFGGNIDGVETVKNLLLETGDESKFL